MRADLFKRYQKELNLYHYTRFVLGTTEQSIIGSLYQQNNQVVISQFQYSQRLKTSSKTTYLPVPNLGLQISQHLYPDSLI